MEQKNIINQIINAIGGEENIQFIQYNHDQLRFTIKDKEKMNHFLLDDSSVFLSKKEEKNIAIYFEDPILDFKKVVALYFPEIKSNYFNEKEISSEVTTYSKVDQIFKVLSDIFTPILPALIGSGLLKSLLPMLTMLNTINPNSGTFLVLDTIADTAFYFMPILLSVSAAKRFQVNTYLAITLACSLLYPNIVSLDVNIDFLSIFTIPKVTYSTSVIPILLGVWAMKYIYRLIDGFIPQKIKMVFNPVLTLLISIPLTLIVFGPLGYYLGIFFTHLSTFLSNNLPIIYGAVFGAMYYFIVMTGTLYAFFPIMLTNISESGFDTGLMPISFFSSILLATSTFAWARKNEDSNFRQLGYSAAISSLFGVTAPSLFGIMTKNKHTFYLNMVLSGVINAVLSYFTIKAYSFVVPGILSLPIFIDPSGDSKNFIIALIGTTVTIISGFLFTSFLSKKKINQDSSRMNPVQKNDTKFPSIIIQLN